MAQPTPEFKPGSEVVYGVHGRCSISAIETKTIGNQEMLFYRLEAQKPIPQRSKRRESSILLPVDSANQKGLRRPMDFEAAQEAMKIIRDREYYFPLDATWKNILPQLEECVTQEGATGLAKIFSYLYVLKDHLVVPPPEVKQFAERIEKQLYRELATAFEETVRNMESLVQRAAQNKLQRSH